jgi:GWxTD domain-containing protein
VFVARYRVSLSFKREGGPSVDVAREEIVRVPTFQETQRADESILFQQILRLTPGTYHVSATVRDVGSTSESHAQADYTAPSFAAGTTSGPILAYQATGRGTLTDPLNLVLNPRGSVGYGSDTLLAYIEGYNFAKPTTVPFKVLDEQRNVVHQTELHFRGGRAVESQVVRLSPDSVALGELTLIVGEGDTERKVSALVSFTNAWVVTNFDEMLDLLRYFGHDDEVNAMRKAPESERARRWREFYVATDPNNTTPENEALNSYFSRIAQANQRFNDEGVAGWRTDRGEVYVNLGPPDEVVENTPGTTANRILRWSYINLRLELFFRDESGFGRLRLLPTSRADYERTLARLRRQS